MRIAIRTDASPTIGTGHLGRCLTLSAELRREGAEVRFVVSFGNGEERLREQNFPFDTIDAATIDDDAKATAALLDGWNTDWVVVDRLGFGRRWEEAVRGVANKIMAVDDLADTPHEADLLLDQNFYPDPDQRYVGLITPATRTLFGPSYALIDPAYAEARRPDSPVKVSGPYRIVVSFGGGDDRGAAVKTLTALSLLRRDDLLVTIVAGRSNPRWSEIEAACGPLPFVTLLPSVASMLPLLAEADLAIGAGGVSTWERFCLGVPTLALTIAPVQKPHLLALAAEGFLQWEGEAGQIAPTALAGAIDDLLDNVDDRATLRERSMGLVDGRGAERVARIMVEG